MEEVYVLDKQFLQNDIIDSYVSLVWTERYSAHGDFVLEVPDSAAARETLTEGKFLTIADVREPMQIETRESSEGILKVSGPSVTGFLKQRMVREVYWSSDQSWEVSGGSAGFLIGNMVKQMMTPGTSAAPTWAGGNYNVATGVAETFPNLIIGDVAPGPDATIEIKYGELYAAIKTQADAFELGFALYPIGITPNGYQLVFTTYAGRDLTSSQSALPVVRFDSALDTLENTKELRSIEAYKTVAYAYPTSLASLEYMVGTAYAYPGAEALRGFDRRTLYVEVPEPTRDENNAYNKDRVIAILNQRAKDALANNNYVRMVDGQIVPQSGYQYGVDYRLGDIIELRTPSGGASKARVTEFIRTQEEAGYSEYPTLAVVD